MYKHTHTGQSQLRGITAKQKQTQNKTELVSLGRWVFISLVGKEVGLVLG